MKVLATLFCLLLTLAGHAQNRLPLRGRLWGQSSEEVEAWLLQAPGFKRVKSETMGNTRMVAYDRITTSDEALVYHFRNDSLVTVTRIALRKWEGECGPFADWKPLEGHVNEWTVGVENAWIRRVYDGEFIRDTFRRIHE